MNQPPQRISRTLQSNSLLTSSVLNTGAVHSAGAQANTPALVGVKRFQVKTNDPNSLGLKLVIYGPAKVGKSTLASLAPNPVFFNLNKGLIGIRAQVVDGIDGFTPLREAFIQANELVPEGGTLVIDSLSEIGEFIEEHLKLTHRKDSISKLGFDRFPCSVEAFRLLLSDLDPVIRAKRNVLILAHEATVTYKNSQGDDFRQLGPDISHATNNSCRDTLVKWADHVVRVSLAEAQVVSIVGANGKLMPGKVMNKTTERYINTDGNNSLIAGSRQIFFKGQYYRLPGLIRFQDANDSTFWEALSDPTIFEEIK